MKAKFVHEMELSKIETVAGEIFEGVDGRHLSITHTDYDIDIWKEDNGETRIKIGFNIQRPGHDHDNYNHILFTIPKGGVKEGEKFKDALLELRHDSGHVGYDMIVADYVYGHYRVDFWDILELAKKKAEKKNEAA